MRAFLFAAAIACIASSATAQSISQPQASYPLPPPPPVVITTPDGRDVPARIDSSDKATRCMQYGASIGVPADQMENYIKRCALQ